MLYIYIYIYIYKYINLLIYFYFSYFPSFIHLSIIIFYMNTYNNQNKKKTKSSIKN